MSPEKFITDKIIQKVESIADVILKHLQEEEAFGPTLEEKDQYQNCSIPPTMERVTT